MTDNANPRHIPLTYTGAAVALPFDVIARGRHRSRTLRTAAVALRVLDITYATMALAAAD